MLWLTNPTVRKSHQYIRSFLSTHHVWAVSIEPPLEYAVGPSVSLTCERERRPDGSFWGTISARDLRSLDGGAAGLRYGMVFFGLALPAP